MDFGEEVKSNNTSALSLFGSLGRRLDVRDTKRIPMVFYRGCVT